MLAGQCRDDRELFADLGRDRFDQGRGQDQLPRLALDRYDRVFQVGFDGGELVARQRPGGGGPHQQIGVLQEVHIQPRTVNPAHCAVNERKSHVDARIGHFPIALAHFAAAQRRAALGPPPDDLVALVQESPVEEVLQRPPDAFDIALVVGDVRLVETDPEPEPFGQLFPLPRIAKDAFQAFANERLDPVRLDLLFRVNAQLFADLDLDRQPVRVPAGLPLAAVAPHGFVTREEVLDGTGKAVAGMRQAVGRRRALVEDKRRSAGPGGQRLVVNPLLLPELGDFFFELGEGNGAVDGLKHCKVRCAKRTKMARCAKRNVPSHP